MWTGVRVVYGVSEEGLTGLWAGLCGTRFESRRPFGRDRAILCRRQRDPPTDRTPDFAPKTPLNRTHGTPSAPRRRQVKSQLEEYFRKFIVDVQGLTASFAKHYA